MRNVQFRRRTRGYFRVTDVPRNCVAINSLIMIDGNANRKHVRDVGKSNVISVWKLIPIMKLMKMDMVPKVIATSVKVSLSLVWVVANYLI